MPKTEALIAAVNAATPRIPPLGAEYPSWYAVNRLPNGEGEVRIYDEIGAWGITADQFAKDLEKIDAKTIHVRINTPGGEVFAGTAIHNALVEHPARIVVHIDGVAASAGSFIAMSGDEIRMADNAYMMIHNARGGVMGDTEDMRRYADLLDKMNNTIAGMYERKAGKTREHWLGLMNLETWFTAEEAKAENLADVVEPTVKKTQPVKSSFDFKIYNKIPDGAKRIWGLTNNEASAADSVTTQDVETPTENQPAPIPSTSVEAVPATNQEKDMSDTNTPSPAPTPAPAPVAPTAEIQINDLNKQAVQGYINQAMLKGKELGRNEGIDRMKAIFAVCPGRPDMAINAFINGQDANTVKLAFEAAAAERAAAEQAQNALKLENARLQALIANGGSLGVNMLPTGMDDEEVQMDPQLQAEQEWDHKPAVRRGFTSKANYVNYRKMELEGRVHIVKS